MTNTVDFSASDKVFVAAGVRKTVEGSNGTVLELSTLGDSNPGAFFLRASADSLANYQFVVRSATTTTSITPSATAPDSSVLSLATDLGVPTTTARRNGALIATVPAPVGGGNFGSYPLYFYRRGGTSLPFNGRDYGTIIRGGTLPSAAEIAQVERYLASKTGVVLS